MKRKEKILIFANISAIMIIIIIGIYYINELKIEKMKQEFLRSTKNEIWENKKAIELYEKWGKPDFIEENKPIKNHDGYVYIFRRQQNDITSEICLFFIVERKSDVIKEWYWQ